MRPTIGLGCGVTAGINRRGFPTRSGGRPRLIDQTLKRYGEAYVIQLNKEQQKCAQACWNAQGHDCECSCMGANHGNGHPGGRWHEVSDTFAFQWGPTQFACRHLIQSAGQTRTGRYATEFRTD